MFALLGDFVGQAAAAKLIGPKSKYGPSRHTYAFGESLAWTKYDNKTLPPYRTMQDVFACMDIRMKTERERALTESGYR
jgi:hypothetical protein